MRPFPPEAELQCFLGDAIAQISLDPHGVRFTFESMRRVVAEFGIEQVDPNGTVWSYDCEAAQGPPLILHRLLYRRVIAIERAELRLTLRFEDGSALVVLTDQGPYEGGHIEAPELGLVVF